MDTDTQLDFKQLFTLLPERYVVVANDPPLFTITAASDAYLNVTGKTRDEIIGKGMFEAFPDTSAQAKKTGRGKLYKILEKCGRTGEPVSTGTLRYDIENDKGDLDVRYWEATHYAIKDANGNVTAIIQNTEDITEKVAADAQLKLNELQQDNALATGLIGMWTWRLEEDVVVADKGLARIMGVDVRAAAKGMPIQRFLEQIHPDDVERVKQSIATALETRQKYECEYRIRDKKGKIRWVIARGKLEHDENGAPVTFPGILIDITLRKLAEDDLRDSERRLRFMADSMPQLVWTTNAAGKNDYFNKQWYEYTGMRPNQPASDVWEKFIHPDDVARVRKKWQAAIKKHEAYEIELRLYYAPTKTYRWVMTRAVPFIDDTGAIAKWYGTCTDIDDRKRSEAIQTFLSEASKKLSASLDYSETLKQVSRLGIPALADWCSVDLYDAETGFTQVAVAHRNPKRVALAREYRRQNPVSIDDPTGLGRVVRTGEADFVPVINMEMVRQYITDPKKLAVFEEIDLQSAMTVPIIVDNKPVGAISFLTSESRRHYTKVDLAVAEELAARVSLSIANAKLYADSLQALERRRELERALKQERDKLEQHVKARTKQLEATNAGLHKEILKRQSVEKELQAYSKELTRSNQELQDFAYVSSHDLQEPLRKIQAFGDLLDSEYGEQLGEGREYLTRMQGAASRMSTLIQDLLAFSRVSTKPNTRQDVDLNAVVSDVISDLEMRINDTEAMVSVAKLPHVIADPTHMRQLFQNLIGNALKFHQADVAPVVDISATTTRQYYEIRVKDNGIGFDMKYLERIFAVFQRLHGREAYEGTGIGLAVCRKIVERYNGTITAESQKNSGSTFIVRLPVGGGGNKI